MQLLLNISQQLIEGKMQADCGFSTTRLELGQEFLYSRSLNNKDIPRSIYSALGMKFNTEKNQASVVENRKPQSDLKHETNLTDIVVTPN